MGEDRQRRIVQLKATVAAEKAREAALRNRVISPARTDDEKAKDRAAAGKAHEAWKDAERRLTVLESQERHEQDALERQRARHQRRNR